MNRRKFISGFTSTYLLSVMGFANLKQFADSSSYCKPVMTHENETLNALASTVIPGPELDPDGVAGAVEVCALNVLYDPTFQIKPMLPALVKDLDLQSILKYQKKFKTLPYENRLQILDDRFYNAIFPINEIYYLATVVIKSAFYAAPFSAEGLESLGYPGGTTGYHSSCSFQRKMSEELTTNGNMP